jgi:DNA-binding transcriptional MerR regulator
MWNTVRTYNEILSDFVAENKIPIGLFSDDLGVTTQTLRNWRQKNTFVPIQAFGYLVNKHGLDIIKAMQEAGDISPGASETSTATQHNLDAKTNSDSATIHELQRRIAELEQDRDDWRDMALFLKQQSNTLTRTGTG